MIDIVEFVDENEEVASGYSADETDSFSPSAHVASPEEDQLSLGDDLPAQQGAYAPIPPDHEDYSNDGQMDFSGLEGPLQSAALLKPSLDNSDKLQQRVSTQLEQKRREKSPELKYQTFQKSANFDTFRPRPRSHFSSDAMSVWPLRSIEESRLLQHFIQNLAPWVSS